MHMTVRRAARLLLAPAALVGFLAGPASSAVADDPAVAWSVSPAAADGTPDGRTRIDLQLASGSSAHDQVLVANASTVEQTFTVYGADAFNTEDGGYDVLPAAEPSRDIGTWVSVPTSSVTIPALSTAVVSFDVVVPEGATPGDHAGGLVVSPTQPTVTDDGLRIDSRVVVRLGVRVAGELTPALDVRGVAASYGSTLLPFDKGAATVRYELVNSGNVKIVGTPRVRVAGPFGLGRVDVAPGDTQEVLPGQSFIVETRVEGVLPFVAMTATVDVAMGAAVGPQTELPLTSSTGRAMFLAVSWTGLLVMLVVVGAVVLVVRVKRRRRREGEELWAAMVTEAGRNGLPGGPVADGAQRSAVVLAIALVALLSGPPTDLDPTASGMITLTVPGPSASPSPSPSTSPSASASPSPSRSGRLPITGGSPTADETAAVPPRPAASPSPGPTRTYATVDTNWRSPSRFGPTEWFLVSLGGAVACGGAVLGVRALARGGHFLRWFGVRR